MPILDADKLIDFKVRSIKELHTQVRTPRAELDVSGGIDSAVVAGFLSRALGPANVTAVYQGINSSPESLDRARLVARAFGLTLIELDLTNIFDQIVELQKNAIFDAYVGKIPIQDLDAIEERLRNDPTILGSLRSTLRAPNGRFANRLLGNGIRHGTGNEDEDRILRFYQKGGDGEVDTAPISMFSKGEIFQLAIALGVPSEILNARPSPDLWGIGEQHSDEEEMSAFLGVANICKRNKVSMYSYVDMTTGQYKNVGLLERINRTLDMHYFCFDMNPTIESYLVASRANKIRDVAEALSEENFPRWRREDIDAVFEAVQRAENLTRHKFNPALPTLGTRAEMLRLEALTDRLPL